MTLATVVFFVSFFGIVSLFALKHWELRRERTLAPVLRSKFDARALQFKELLAAARVDLAKVPPFALRLVRVLIREAAIGFAVLARVAERQAYRLADLVSHKHRFEKRETRSEFLKKVSEHKSGNGLETSEDNGQNT
jgi:hypothetical protein